MTDLETIRRLQQALDNLSEWRHGIDIARSAEAERMAHIDKTLKDLQAELHAWRTESNAAIKKGFWLVVGIIGAVVIRWVLQGNLAGAL